MALGMEVAELLERYQWLMPNEAAQPTTAQREAGADEMADVLSCLLQLPERINAARKYPARGAE